MTTRVRIGAVAYLNAHPLTYGLQQLGDDPRFELSLDVPAVLADRMSAGELDVALLPVIELARIPDLDLVPGLGIGTRGPARSVLLVSRKPIEEIETVSLDPESRTSNAMIQVLFRKAWGTRPRFVRGPVSLDDALRDAHAAVRIGDKALFEPVPEGLEVHDLGAVWTAGTGMPFVYAAWAARPGIIDQPLHRLLHASRREGSRNLEKIAAEFRWNGEARPEAALDYLQHHIRYRLGAAELDGLRAFLGAAAELGLIEAAPRLRLALQRWTHCHEDAARLGVAATKV